MYTVSSEIYKETNFQPVKGADGKVVSKFKFRYPTADEEQHKANGIAAAPKVDKDGDLLLQRRVTQPSTDIIELEHSDATELKLVGLQVWRGALLLADFIFARRQQFRNMQIMELGAGVGLTSIAASIYVRKVICTDVDLGCILKLIRSNIKRNARLMTAAAAAAPCTVDVLEFDFLQSKANYAKELLQAIDESDIIVAADVIYDDELTLAFISVIDAIFERQRICGRKKTIYVALEKRYVFTMSECDAVAPMFEHFIKQTMNKPWRFVYVPLDFPQYFEYERCKELVLLELSSA